MSRKERFIDERHAGTSVQEHTEKYTLRRKYDMGCIECLRRKLSINDQ